MTRRLLNCAAVAEGTAPPRRCVSLAALSWRPLLFLLPCRSLLAPQLADIMASLEREPSASPQLDSRYMMPVYNHPDQCAWYFINFIVDSLMGLPIVWALLKVRYLQLSRTQAFTHTHARTHAHAHARTHTHTHRQIDTHTCARKHTHTYTLTQAHRHADRQTDTYTRARKHTHRQTYTHELTCVPVAWVGGCSRDERCVRKRVVRVRRVTESSSGGWESCVLLKAALWTAATPELSACTPGIARSLASICTAAALPWCLRNTHCCKTAWLIDSLTMQLIFRSWSTSRASTHTGHWWRAVSTSRSKAAISTASGRSRPPCFCCASQSPSWLW